MSRVLCGGHSHTRAFFLIDFCNSHFAVQVYVNEPSVLDTISILRGLKEKYEAHHGVTISDSALVAAAQLSSR